MSDTPQEVPDSVAEVVVPEVSRTFEAPRGFETKFRGLALHLTTFEGPLDLLLHLIHEQKLDLLNLPMAEVTRQYMDYLKLMEELNLEIAAEFVAMAAQLLQIKSRLMLPRPPQVCGEEDPREALVQRLLDYQQVKAAAQVLSSRESEWQKIAFAPGIAGVDHAGDILALEQADQQFEAVFRAIQWAQCKSGRDHRQIGKGPFATFDFELLGHHELEQMPDRRGHQIRFALVIVAVAGESAQCASDVIRHRGLFCNDEFLAHWPG